jgi:hypothetical protein
MNKKSELKNKMKREWDTRERNAYSINNGLILEY